MKRHKEFTLCFYHEARLRPVELDSNGEATLFAVMLQNCTARYTEAATEDLCWALAVCRLVRERADLVYIPNFMEGKDIEYKMQHAPSIVDKQAEAVRGILRKRNAYASATFELDEADINILLYETLKEIALEEKALAEAYIAKNSNAVAGTYEPNENRARYDFFYFLGGIDNAKKRIELINDFLKTF